MKIRTTVILALALVVLALWLWTSDEAPRAPADAGVGDRVFAGDDFVRRDARGALGLSDIAERVEIKAGAGAFSLQRTLVRGRSAWRFTEPFDRPADDFEVDRLLSEMEFLEPATVIRAEPPDRLDLAEYGLADPAHSVRFGIGEREWTLLVGSRAPSEDEVYVKRADAETVWVVPDAMLRVLEAGIDRYRDKRALRADRYAVTDIAFRSGDETLAAAKRGGRWRLVKPVEDLADGHAIERALVAAVGDPAMNARGIEVAEEDFVGEVSEGLAEYGLARPSRVLELAAGEQEETLLFGAIEGDKMYAKRAGEDTVFKLPLDIVETVFPDRQDLRGRHLLSFDPGEVREIVVESGGQRVVIGKRNGQWQVREPDPSPAEAREVERFLARLSEAAVLDWIDRPGALERYGLDEPEAILRLNAAGEGESHALVLGGPFDERRFHARRGQSGPVLVIGETVRDLVLSAYLDFLPRLMLSFPMESARAIAIVRDGERVEIELADGAWRMVEPARAAADRITVEGVLWDMTELRARRIVARAPGDLGRYGLEKPHIVASVRVGEGEGAKTHELRIGALAGDTRYAMLADSDIVFLVEPSLIRRLKDEFARRRLLDFEPDRLASAVLRDAETGREKRIERKGDVWVAAGAEEELVPGGAGERFARAVANVSASRVADYRPEALAPYGLDRPRVEIVLEFSDGGGAWLRVGAEKDGLSYVQASETGFVYEVHERDIGRIAAGW